MSCKKRVTYGRVSIILLKALRSNPLDGRASIPFLRAKRETRDRCPSIEREFAREKVRFAS